MNDLRIGFDNEGKKVITIGDDTYLGEQEKVNNASICEIIERSFRVSNYSIIDEGENNTVTENTVIICRCNIKINSMDIEQETSFFACDAGFDIGDRLNTIPAFLRSKNYAVSRLLM